MKITPEWNVAYEQKLPTKISATVSLLEKSGRYRSQLQVSIRDVIKRSALMLDEVLTFR